MGGRDGRRGDGRRIAGVSPTRQNDGMNGTSDKDAAAAGRRFGPIAWIWLVVAVVYAALFSWYTSFGGPLSDEEISGYLAAMQRGDRNAAPEDLARIRRFMEEDTGDDFAMLNVIDMYETPLRIEGVAPGDTSEEVLARYMQYMWPALLSRASHPVFSGSAANTAMDLMNAPGMDSWTSGALMRYRSRRDLFDIATNPEFAGSHEFKVAAMRKTIAYPLDPWFQLGDPRLVVALLLGMVGCGLSWLVVARRRG